MINLADHPLVESDWLADHLAEPGLRIVDARWRGDGSSRELYRAGHISGAVPLDWHLDLSCTEAGVRDLILPAERFAEVMGAAGIGDDTAVIAYAETDHSSAARLWWALRYYGHDQVAVLNGGITKWLAEGRPATTQAPQPAPAHFTPRPRPWLRATADEIAQALQSDHVRLVDTRPREQYIGRAVWTPSGSAYVQGGQATIDIGGRGPMRTGHIPGAVHWHASTNFDEQSWTYLPPEALKQRAQSLGLRTEQRVITYCGVGISASVGLFALHLAGFQDIALYDASWEEWGTDPARPVEQGTSASDE